MYFVGRVACEAQEQEQGKEVQANRRVGADVRNAQHQKREAKRGAPGMASTVPDLLLTPGIVKRSGGGRRYSSSSGNEYFVCIRHET